MLSSSEIRRAFLDYFEERGHARLPSGPLVPANDPTLMFTNAGMVQFKDVFTGKETREQKRATTSQKCIRISGKHNDLENVGFTPSHHTFFEMLGNFSFGDYFKRDAITYSWELLTDVFGIPKDRLVVSVFEGDGEIPADDEAASLCGRRSRGYPTNGSSAATPRRTSGRWATRAPCGPCTEIHYFMGTDEPDLSLFGEDPTPEGTGWVEVWNNVFMQFERHEDGSLTQRSPRPRSTPGWDSSVSPRSSRGWSRTTTRISYARSWTSPPRSAASRTAARSSRRRRIDARHRRSRAGHRVHDEREHQPGDRKRGATFCGG